MSGDVKSYCVDWFAGPSVQIELSSPKNESEGYRMKYTPPFRRTIRPPVRELKVGKQALDPIKERLNELIRNLEGRSRAGTGAALPPPAPEKDILDDMELLGDQLYTFLIQQYVQADLRTRGQFLEIGMDSELMNYPWELMHDGEDFLCLKHFVGRFVISESAPPINMHPSTPLGSSLETLSILLISVPTPQPRSKTEKYETLEAAEAETKAMIDSLDGIENVELQVLPQKKATFDKVYRALKKGKYHILHFNGHAHFNDQHPHRSGLVLFDRDMETGQLSTTILSRARAKPPILCFINACETARPVEGREGEENRLNMYGLARAFLDTGAYLLGSRWKVGDDTAKEFAKKFYTSLIKDGKSIGESIVHARKACKAAIPAELFGWATYVYYGDPRVCFRRP